MKDQNELQSTHRDLPKHFVVWVLTPYSTGRRDRMHVLNLGRLSMCDRDDSIRLIFAAKEMLAEQAFDYHFLH